VVGVVFAGNANSAHDEQVAISKAAGGHACAPGSATCDAFHSKGADVSSASTISYVGYIAGGAGLAAALVWTGYNLFAKSDPAKNGSKTSFTPWIGSQGAGASFELKY
jgi:hypothetical protein